MTKATIQKRRIVAHAIVWDWPPDWDAPEGPFTKYDDPETALVVAEKLDGIAVKVTVEKL